MVSPNPDKFAEVMKLINDWSSDDRVAIARHILTSEQSSLGESRRFNSLEDLVGLLASFNVPQGLDYRRIRDEELLRKYLS